MAAITTPSTGPKLREYSQQLRRDAQELLNAAEEARHRAQIAVERSRERKERIGAVGQLEPEPAQCTEKSQRRSTAVARTGKTGLNGGLISGPLARTCIPAMRLSQPASS
jgi:hypothetical protein